MTMTPQRRIAINVIATYGRSMYALIVGLFCGRWKLLTLGHIDYGLLGVVGGLAGFVSFINSILSEAIGRFYAYSVGSASKDNSLLCLEECRRWFSVAVALHLMVSVILIAVGFPSGVYAIRNFLTIPVDRIQTCIGVWTFVCASCFISMANVPFRAMYIAKQEIAEMTIYGFATTTLNFLFLFFAVYHPNHNWLLLVSGFSSLMIILPELCICIRSFVIFEECRFKFSYCLDFSKLRMVFYYAGCRFMTALALMLNNNGMSVLVNKCLGPLKNASMTIGMLVSGNCMSLSGAMSASFAPAVTQAAGAGDNKKMINLALRASKFSTIGLLLFALPVMVEIDEIMRLWLKNPPVDASVICICMLLVALCDQISSGHCMSIFAIGKIGRFNIVETIIWFLVIPIAYISIKAGYGIAGVGGALVFSKALAVANKLYFGHKIGGLPVFSWIAKFLVPLALSVIVSLCCSSVVIAFVPASFVRVIYTTLVIEITFGLIIWWLVLDDDEKKIISSKAQMMANQVIIKK